MQLSNCQKRTFGLTGFAVVRPLGAVSSSVPVMESIGLLSLAAAATSAASDAIAGNNSLSFLRHLRHKWFLSPSLSPSTLSRASLLQASLFVVWRPLNSRARPLGPTNRQARGRGLPPDILALGGVRPPGFDTASLSLSSISTRSAAVG